MRGSSLVAIGIILLVGALALVFLFPDQAPDGATNREPESNVVTDSPGEKNSSPVASAESSESKSHAAADPEPQESTNAKSTAGHDETSDQQKFVPRKEELKFVSWPVPKAGLVITGEQLGYFEPCGCTANQLGGMNRRASLTDKLRELGWTARGIDLGSMSRRSVRQSQIKFEITLQALREMKYVAIGLGPEELRLDPGYLISQHTTDGDLPIAFVSSNLTFFGTPDLGTPLPWKVVDINGVKVGMTSVMSDSRRREVIPDRSPEDAANADIQWLDPVESLKKALEHFEGEGVQFKVLLSQSSVNESRDFARQFPAFDIVVTSKGFGDGEQEAEMIGTTRLLQVGEKGKHAGVVGLYPDHPDQPVRFELVTLSGENFGESETMIRLMQTYQDQLKDERMVTADGPVSHPTGAQFVGAAKCGECHTKAFEVFEKTAHADAFKSLDPHYQREGFERLNGIIRTHDPECLACHVTGWEPKEYLRFRSGFINEDMAETDEDKLLQSLLAGNQCENCHGPGSQHIEQIEADNIEAARSLMKVPLSESGCVKCHDGENSPDFNFEEYWEAIKHPGLD
ncbi:MAG: hypothetical protein KDA91_02015 [Planctomycetaceae bacterium]|nr:hypothetical protein [Planctomycetaceae bacterium]